MKLNRFVEDRQARWDGLQSLISAAGKRPEKLRLGEIRALAAGYRGVAADLAIARRHFSGDPIVTRLERLAVTSRALVYERQSRRESLIAFLADGFWQLLWARRVVLGIAALALLGPGLIGLLWGITEPESVRSVVPAGFLWVAEEQTTDQGLGAVGLAGFSTYVMVNNIRVTLAAFAFGLSFGLGTAYLLLFNGLILGGASGLAIEAGNGELLVAALAAHGVLELTCIVVGGAGGLSLGWAMLRPRKQTRRQALMTEASDAFRIAGGTLPWLVLAGLIEGYVSRVGLGPVPTTIVGVLVGGTFWALLLWRGHGSEVRVGSDT